MKKRIVHLCLLLLVPFVSKAQIYDQGTDPASVKWRQIKTAQFQLIYPKGADSLANRYAFLFERTLAANGKSLGQQTKPFPIVLRTNTVRSNGFVVWAPKRMELVTQPSSSAYSQPWDKQLVLHEARHVVQMEKLNHGIFRGASYFLGQQSVGIATVILPDWFLEGDAVATETALSRSGRGRLPEFATMPFRAQMLTEEAYSYEKWKYGSFLDYTPGQYNLGYNMIAGARYYYGADIWDKVIGRSVRRFYILPPVTNALRHYIGMPERDLYKKIFDGLKADWQKEDEAFTPLPDIRFWTKEPKTYTNYSKAVPLNDTTLLAIKSNYDNLPALVKVYQNGVEEELRIMANLNSDLSVHGEWVYWSETLPALRWEQKSSSVVKSLNLTTGKVRTHARRTKYFNPIVSPNGNQYVVRETKPNGDNFLLIFNIDDNLLKKELPLPSFVFPKDYVWKNDNELIVSFLGDDGVSMVSINAENEMINCVSNFSFNAVNTIHFYNNSVLFESGFSGRNNIYALDLESKEILQLTDSRFGAFSPKISQNNELVFSDYSSEGCRLVSLPLDKVLGKRVQLDSTFNPTPFVDYLSAQEGFNSDTVVYDPATNYRSKPYRELPHLLRFHSWAPLYYDPDKLSGMDMDEFTSSISLGAMFLSQNSLSTAFTNIGYSYDGYSALHLGFTYKKFFPVVNIKADYSDKNQWIVSRKFNQNGVLRDSVYRGNNNSINLKLNAYLPFNFSNGRYTRGLTPLFTYEFKNNEYQDFESGSFFNFQEINASIQYYQYLRMAVKDIYPRWGYSVKVQGVFSPNSSDNFGVAQALQLRGYFPGILKHHSLRLGIGIQAQDVRREQYAYEILDLPRGYNKYKRTENYQIFSVDYSFPLLYPDYTFLSTFYVKRVRSNIFFDWAHNNLKSINRTERLGAVGASLSVDGMPTFFYLPMQIGIQVTRPFDSNIAVGFICTVTL